MFIIKNVDTGEEQVSSVRPEWVSGVWECGAFRLTDQHRTIYEVVENDPSGGGRVITAYAFRARFTLPEKGAMEMAAVDDPAASTEVRKAAADMRALLKDFEAARYIDLGDARTRGGVERLEAAGLLDAGRAAEILDAPVRDVERYT